MRLCHIALFALLPGAVAAQDNPSKIDHDQMVMPGMLTPYAQDQIAEAKRAAADLDTPEKARAAGYRPRFGDVPLQGEHWTNPRLVLSGTFDVAHPPILMFAPIGGEQKLLGVAYAYEVKEGDAVPDAFDGAAMWHEHPALALPGRRLVMTHVWFVPSPNGVFAHDNPTLVFLERGLTYPPDGWLDAATLRRLALTLQLAQRQAPAASRLFNGPRNDSVVAVLEMEQAAINSLVPQLEAARRGGKKAQYQLVAVKIGNRADEIIATIKQVPLDPVSRAFLARLIDEALSDSHAAANKTP